MRRVLLALAAVLLVAAPTAQAKLSSITLYGDGTLNSFWWPNPRAQVIAGLADLEQFTMIGTGPLHHVLAFTPATTAELDSRCTPSGIHTRYDWPYAGGSPGSPPTDTTPEIFLRHYRTSRPSAWTVVSVGAEDLTLGVPAAQIERHLKNIYRCLSALRSRVIAVAPLTVSLGIDRQLLAVPLTPAKQATRAQVTRWIKANQRWVVDLNVHDGTETAPRYVGSQTLANTIARVLAGAERTTKR